MELKELFTQIANAIRSKKMTSAQIPATSFPNEIASIEGGAAVENFGVMYLTQHIDGDYCTIELNSTGNDEDAVMVGYAPSGDGVKIYLTEV